MRVKAKQLFSKPVLIAASLLVSFPALGQDDSTQGTTMRVENGVTIKSGDAVQRKLTESLVPEKKAADKREDFPVDPPKPASSAAPAAAAQAPEDDEEPPEDLPTGHEKKKVAMKPIIDKSTKATAATARFNDTKGAKENPKDSPFKKSRDAGTVETLSKPAPKPEVSGRSLMDGDMAGDLKNLDAMKKKDKATNAEDGVGESGLPIPRFVSLKSGEVNARTGPGDTYPIRWVYQRKNLPVEVTAEFKLWRRVKDFDGEQSWVHQALISSRHYAILSGEATAKSDYQGTTSTARFKRGVQVRVLACKKDECKVEYGNVTGWLKKKDLWGVYANDIFD